MGNLYIDTITKNQQNYIIQDKDAIESFTETAITDTVPATFDGHPSGDFLLKNEANQIYATQAEVQDNFLTQVNAETTYLRKDTIVNNLNSTSTTSPLSANQGRVLQSKIDLTNVELDKKVEKTGGVMAGKLVAQNNNEYNICQARNISFSTNEPTAQDGANGDIWIVYEV